MPGCGPLHGKPSGAGAREVSEGPWLAVAVENRSSLTCRAGNVHERGPLPNENIYDQYVLGRTWVYVAVDRFEGDPEVFSRPNLDGVLPPEPKVKPQPARHDVAEDGPVTVMVPARHNTRGDSRLGDYCAVHVEGASAGHPGRWIPRFQVGFANHLDRGHLRKIHLRGIRTLFVSAELFASSPPREGPKPRGPPAPRRAL
jgi:hypothetical protein